jgi:hypothetical protein
LGYYTPDNCPRYLQKENYPAMKKHLQNNKLILVHGTILSAIEASTVPITGTLYMHVNIYIYLYMYMNIWICTYIYQYR